jgi:HEPN domain-containing protein
MSLEDWARTGRLRRQPSSRNEIHNLLAISDRDLETWEISGMPADTKLGLAYNAALQAANAALRAMGYRATGTAHHHRVIQSLVHTIGLERESVTLFDTFRKKRNISNYEMAGVVSESDAEEIYRLAKEIRSQVERWLWERFPQFMED